MRHADSFENFLHALLAFGGRHAAIGQREFHVFVNGEVADQVEGLKDEADLAIADAGAIRQRKVRHGLGIDPVIAFRGRIEQPENREQRGFAAARRTGDREEFAVLDFQVHAAERVGLHFIGVENLGHAIQANQALFGGVHALLLREVADFRACVSSPTDWYEPKALKSSRIISTAPDRNCPKPTCRTG